MQVTITIKRGLSKDRLNYTPAEGELIYTTDTHELYVGDGSTAGGIKIDGNYFIPQTEKAQANGVATLDENGKIPTDQLPALSISEVFVVNSEDEQLNLDAQTGDIAVRTDERKTYIRNNNNNGDMSDWTEILTPDAVTSVNGKTGDVVLYLKDIKDVDDNLNPNNGDVLIWDANNSKWVSTAASNVGRTTFLGLDDTPGSYSGQGGKLVAVKEDESGLEFVDQVDGGWF